MSIGTATSGHIPVTCTSGAVSGAMGGAIKPTKHVFAAGPSRLSSESLTERIPVCEDEMPELRAVETRLLIDGEQVAGQGDP
jgi:hypothetical protein